MLGFSDVPLPDFESDDVVGAGGFVDVDVESPDEDPLSSPPVPEVSDPEADAAAGSLSFLVE